MNPFNKIGGYIAAFGVFALGLLTFWQKAKQSGEKNEQLKNQTRVAIEKGNEVQAIKGKMKSDQSIEHTNRSISDDELYSGMSKHATKNSDSV